MGIEEGDSSPGAAKTRKRKASAEEIEIDISAAEPPSKKALRKVKKITLLKRPESSFAIQSSGSQQPITEPTSSLPPAEKSDYGIWLGNLPFSANKEDVRKFLVDNSNIIAENITRVHVPSVKESGQARNKGFAYVDLRTLEALEAALSLSEKLIKGRRVLIKDAKNFEGRPQKQQDAHGSRTGPVGAKPPTNRVFVGNLAFDTTDDDIKEHFARCGTVTDVHVATFEDSGKCKGYAWVTFNDIEAASAAVRGWVKIPEENTSDSEDEKRSEADGDAESKKASKKPKLRKWWMNKIKGRPLRMEFAEDPAIRYKKRFGKDGTARKDADTPIQEDQDHSTESSKSGRFSRGVRIGQVPVEQARLTGEIVKGRGTKTTFA